jgi:tetratricopeptide (TPR) repeat protein
MDAIKTLDTPIALNNRAVAMINDGVLEAAISTISDALHTTRDMIEEAEEGTPRLTLHLTLDGLMTKCVHLDNSCDSQEQKTFMYRRAIYIDAAEDTTCSYESREVASAVLIYNLALAYQLAAAKTTTGNDRYLEKSAKLYGLAIRILHEAHLESSTFFYMTCINNMGLAYQDLRDIAKAQKCFEHLLSNLMFLVDFGMTDVVPDMDGFFMNTSYLVVAQASAAAA